jgi:hypothetical protein
MLLMLEEAGHLFAVEHMNERAFLRSNGGYMVPLYDEEPIFWLPCHLHELREPLLPSDFVADITFPVAELTDDYSEAAFQVVGDRAYPKRGISVDAIRAKLTGKRLPLSEFACPLEDES